MISRKIYLITAHENYVIGTQSLHIYKKIGPAPKVVSVKRSSFDDVATDVNFGLRKLNITSNYNSITIDTHASIELLKASPADQDPKVISMEEFFLYPFKNYLGIILPYNELYTADQSVVFQANIIDPVADIDRFRNDLRNL